VEGAGAQGHLERTEGRGVIRRAAAIDVTIGSESPGHGVVVVQGELIVTPVAVPGKARTVVTGKTGPSRAMVHVDVNGLAKRVSAQMLFEDVSADAQENALVARSADVPRASKRRETEVAPATSGRPDAHV